MSLIYKYLFIIVAVCFFHNSVEAQNFGQGMGGMSNFNNSSQRNSKADSLKRRDKNADSITIYYKLYNSNEIQKLDSSINDFYKHYPLPYTSYHLGNLGTASRSYLFNSIKEAGWDDGFHAFDTYNFTLQETPYYQTTRPFTEFGYLLGSKGEQMVDIKHTQNKTQQLNFSFEYRFTNAPGNVKNQKSNSNQMRITAHFQSKRKRYESYWTLILNSSASSENGGLVNAALLDSLSLNNPYELETRLGISGASFRNPFNTYVATGTSYQKNIFNWRQSYDFGQKDSIVKDTIVTHLFYPRLRLQNEIKIQSSQFKFSDANPNMMNYAQYFDFTLDSIAPFNFTDNWNYINDEFSIISYPDKMNSNQFLQLGAGYDLFYASFPNQNKWTNYNIYSFAVYKNKTKNQLWDLLASGKLFLNGYHAGDYNAKASLSRMLNNKGTFLQVSFQNLNRTPSSNTMGISQFPIVGFSSIKKENSTILSGVIGNEKAGWSGSASYQVIQNYQYFSTGFQPVVYGNLMNYLRAQIDHKVKISKHWSWYDQITLQALDPNAPVNVPFLLTRQRVAFEGNFYKNLNLSTGLEIIYHTNYKADAYMPITGQFYLQNNYTTQNRPTANAYLNFMIKRFKGYIRLENLNTLLPSSNKFGNAYNFTAQNYPSTGLWFRIGIWWNFIN